MKLVWVVSEDDKDEVIYEENSTENDTMNDKTTR
jgi:hypothetical protein